MHTVGEIERITLVHFLIGFFVNDIIFLIVFLVEIVILDGFLILVKVIGGRRFGKPHPHLKGRRADGRRIKSLCAVAESLAQHTCIELAITIALMHSSVVVSGRHSEVLAEVHDINHCVDLSSVCQLYGNIFLELV